ncbi:hypothetical protein [Skermanella pratensis]|uniref:hypothetical protein n=1 Tax=Skermanella pratensis TaxID=2233999 RepID=UPI00130147C6|nr:hypothetical protein [Skermanella pratensis]
MAASSGMVMSPFAFTQPIRRSAWRAGSSEPAPALRYASRMLVLGLTPNRRAAARHEFPLSIAPMIRTRKSDE